MFIKEVILEGFKSYAQRTVISGFDCHFNAITGLNGSGKSNILDAVCFVLGISNMSSVNIVYYRILRKLLAYFFFFVLFRSAYPIYKD